MIVAGAPRTAKADAKLIAAARKAHRMLKRKRGLPLVGASRLSAYDRSILRLAFLAPDLQRDILPATSYRRYISKSCVTLRSPYAGGSNDRR